MPRCCTCRADKDTIDFHWKNREAGTLQPYCKECKQEYNRRWYECHKVEQKARARANSKRYVARNREALEIFVDARPCSCGETDLDVMEFHHRDPKGKDYVISDIVRNGNVSLGKLWREMKKCDPMCSCCHRKFHALVRRGEIEYSDISWWTRALWDAGHRKAPSAAPIV